MFIDGASLFLLQFLVRSLATPVLLLDHPHVLDCVHAVLSSSLLSNAFVLRCLPCLQEFDLEAEEYVPLPKGEVHKKKEVRVFVGLGRVGNFSGDGAGRVEGNA